MNPCMLFVMAFTFGVVCTFGYVNYVEGQYVTISHPRVITLHGKHEGCPPGYDHVRRNGGINECLYNPPEPQ